MRNKAQLGLNSFIRFPLTAIAYLWLEFFSYGASTKMDTGKRTSGHTETLVMEQRSCISLLMGRPHWADQTLRTCYTPNLSSFEANFHSNLVSYIVQA